MADAITYADLRFVKVPLKNNASNHSGQDCEAYEDGELTYENVSPVPGGPPGLVSPALADKAGVRSEQPTASWSSVKSSALGQILRCAYSYSTPFTPVPRPSSPGWPFTSCPPRRRRRAPTAISDAICVPTWVPERWGWVLPCAR